MNKRHIPGFFDALARTPSFVFLCSMFLCGAAAGGLTGLHAAEGDCALELTALLRELPGQAGKSVLCAVLWLVLPPAAALFRPAALWLSIPCVSPPQNALSPSGTPLCSDSSVISWSAWAC